MKEQHFASLELYINRMFKIIIVSIPAIGLIAGLTFSTIKLLGFYPEVPINSLLVFDATNVLYFIVGLVFLRKCSDSGGSLRPNVLRRGKIFILCVEFIQWNFISFMIPSRGFWAYILFFAALAIFFFDSRFTAAVIAELVLSLVVSWLIRPEYLLPVRDDFLSPK